MNTKRTKLNIPSEDDQFEAVAFVHKMTMYQLKVIIKRLWHNIHDLANSMDSRRKDITAVLDKICDGNTWKDSDIDDRYFYGTYKNFRMKFDTLDKTFTIMDKDYNPVEKPFPAYTMRELRKKLTEIKKQRRRVA